MKECNVILEIFRKFKDNSPIKTEIPKDIKDKDIENLVQKGIIEEDFEPPAHCQYDGCGEQAEIRVENDKIIVKCAINPHHLSEIPKDDYIVYRIKISKGFEILLMDLLDKFNVISEYSTGDYCKLTIDKDGKQITFIFCMEELITEEKLFNILSPHLSRKDFIVLIYKTTQNNFENIDAIRKKLPLGSIIFDMPLDKIKNTKLQSEFQRWLNYISEITKLEKSILDKIDDDDLRELTASIDTNPKYILSALSRIKLFKVCGIKTEGSWEDMEDLIRLIFYHIYTSDIQHGGGKQRGKGVPDNVFFVEEATSIKIAGIVDSKCSFNADLSKEKTEKYENYLEKVRQLKWAIPKKALIFVVFETKSGYTTNEFFRRIKTKLKQGEYVIVLPVESLELLIYAYLGVILRGQMNLNKNDFNDLLNQIFDNDFLDKKRSCKIENGLYTIPLDFVLEELKSRSKSGTSVEAVFKEIFEI